MKKTQLKLLWLLTAFLLLYQPKICAQEYMRINLKNGTAISFALSDIQKLTFDLHTGITEQTELVKQLLKLKAYPNPAKDHVIIEYSLIEQGDVWLEIFNSVGNTIVSKTIGLQSPGNHQYQWLLHGVPTGLYICRIKQHNQIVSEKIIVKK